MVFLRRQQLRIVHHLSHQVDRVAQTATLLFCFVVLLEILIHRLSRIYPALKWLDTLQVSSSLDVAIVGLHFAIATLLLLYLVGIRVYLVHPTRRWKLILEDADLMLRLKQGPTQFELENCQVEFVSDSQPNFHTLVDLNQVVFSRSSWAMDPEPLRHRNQAFIRRFTYAFMLMRNPLKKQGSDYIGYSCIFPLTAEGADAYRNKAHGDLDMPSWFIASVNEPPAVILIFAVALLEKYRFRCSGADREFSEYFINCIWCHLLTIYTPWAVGGRTPPPLWAQAEEGPLKRRLHRLGFTGTKSFTKDELEILEFAGRIR